MMLVKYKKRITLVILKKRITLKKGKVNIIK